jgi:hypothetical protein
MVVILSWTLPNESMAYARHFKDIHAAVYYVKTRGLIPRGMSDGFVQPVIQQVIDQAVERNQVQSDRVLSSMMVTVVP